MLDVQDNKYSELVIYSGEVCANSGDWSEVSCS